MSLVKSSVVLPVDKYFFFTTLDLSYAVNSRRMADVPENFMKYENIKDKVISYVFNIAIDIATSKWWFLSWMSSALLIYIYVT